MIEDELLKLKFKCGSSDALSRIYEKYADFLLTLAMALLNDENLAEDVLHDFFVSFAKSTGNFKLAGSLKSYLATCIVNRARDQIRANKRRPDRLQKTDLQSSDYDGPVQSVIGSEESTQLASAMAQLPDEQREAVILHLKAGMKFREIAKMQDVSINTAMGRYRYGLNKLRSVLDGEAVK